MSKALIHKRQYGPKTESGVGRESESASVDERVNGCEAQPRSPRGTEAKTCLGERDSRRRAIKCAVLISDKNQATLGSFHKGGRGMRLWGRREEGKG